MSNPKTSKATPNATSLQALQDGAKPSASPDGPMTGQCGPDHARVSHSARLGRGLEQMTLGICGRNSSASSKPAAPEPSSGNKSHQRLDANGYVVKVKSCRSCGKEKPFSEFYKNSKGQIRNTCKSCDRLAERERKRANPQKTSENYSTWRQRKRGHALVNVAKHRAKNRGLEFNLDPEEIQAVIDEGHCQATGLRFDLDTPRAWNAPSLDRINPSGGYTKDNVQVVLYALNVMANTWGHQKVVEIANAIMEKRRLSSAELQGKLTSALKRRLNTNASPEYVLTWKQWDMPAGPPICALRASVRRTLGKGFGGWATPRAADATKNIRSREGAIKEAKRKGGNNDLGVTAALSSARTEKKGALNPEFARWLMGYPTIWASYAPSKILRGEG